MFRIKDKGAWGVRVKNSCKISRYYSSIRFGYWGKTCHTELTLQTGPGCEWSIDCQVWVRDITAWQSREEEYKDVRDT